jgi:hypothetical protein
MHRVPFVSQRDYAFSRVTCGVAATMMLLRFHYRRKRIPSYPDLRLALGIDIPLADKNTHYERIPGIGVSPDHVITYLRANGVRYRATCRKSKRQRGIVLRRLQVSPIMVGMGNNAARWGDSGHWIVLVGTNESMVFYLNPSNRRPDTRPNRMRMAAFRRQWDGSSIQVVGFR